MIDHVGSAPHEAEEPDAEDVAPGEESAREQEPIGGLTSYVVGLGLAVLLTAASFYMVGSDLIWRPAVPAALIALAVGQMGVHLVFFLHLTSGPDNTNNMLALAFGVLIVLLVVLGSIWIMGHLNHQMPSMPGMMGMMR